MQTQTILTAHHFANNQENKLFYAVHNEIFLHCNFNNLTFSGSLVTATIFKNVNFENCLLFGTYFKNCHFIGCNFKNCNFEFSNLTNCNFTSCNIENCTWENTPLKKSTLSLSFLDMNTVENLTYYQSNMHDCYWPLEKVAA